MQPRPGSGGVREARMREVGDCHKPPCCRIGLPGRRKPGFSVDDQTLTRMSP